jgi:hypothetical protein
MNAHANFEAIYALDLDQIKSKLMHPDAGEGWSRDKVDAVEEQYRRFLCVMQAFPDEQTSPMVDVDTFWHYHILDTMKYARDCAQAFGYFVHHFPYLGLRGDDDALALEASGDRMAALYEQLFEEPYGQALSAWCAKTDTAPQAAWCAKSERVPTTAAWCAKSDSVRAKAAWCAKADNTRARAAWCAKADTAPTAAWCAKTGAASPVLPVKSPETTPA